MKIKNVRIGLSLCTFGDICGRNHLFYVLLQSLIEIAHSRTHLLEIQKYSSLPNSTTCRLLNLEHCLDNYSYSHERNPKVVHREAGGGSPGRPPMLFGVPSETVDRTCQSNYLRKFDHRYSETDWEPKYAPAELSGWNEESDAHHPFAEHLNTCIQYSYLLWDESIYRLATDELKLTHIDIWVLVRLPEKDLS